MWRNCLKEDQGAGGHSRKERRDIWEKAKIGKTNNNGRLETVFMYRNHIKRLVDVILSTVGIVILAPAWLILAIAIKVDDPGPFFSRQKRIARNRNGEEQFFQIYKYRSMKMSTPHDVPTHMLENPEQYITRVSKFLRKTSLEGNDIIRQTTKSLINKGFREVSPIHFHQGCNLISNELNTAAA